MQQKSKNSWEASIGFLGRNIHIGSFSSEAIALRARIEAESEYYGEFAYNHYMDFEGRDGEV